MRLMYFDVDQFALIYGVAEGVLDLFGRVQDPRSEIGS